MPGVAAPVPPVSSASWLWSLYVVHGVGAAPPLLDAAPKVLEGDPIDHARDGDVDLLPKLAEVAGILPVRRPPHTPAGVRAHRALHRPQDGADRDLVGRAAQTVSTRRAAARQEKAGTLELQQH